MSSPKSNVQRPKSNVSRHWTWDVGLWTLLIVLSGSGYYFWYRITTPAVPAIKLEGSDPAVAKAVEEARNVVRQSPRSGSAWGRLAMVLSIHDFLSEADHCFGQAERFDAREPRWPYLRGLARSGENPEAALPHLRRAAALCDSLPAPNLRLAELLVERSQFDEAQGYIRRVLDQDPENGRALLALGQIAFARGQLRESLAYLNRSVTSSPGIKASHALLATVQQRLGDTAAAEAAFRQASTLPETPVWPDPYLIEVNRLRTGLATTTRQVEGLLKQGEVTRAVTLMEQAVRDYPDKMNAWLVYGKALTQATNFAVAEKALTKAVALEPESVEARIELANTFFAAKQFSEAEANYREILRLNPNLAEAWFDLGLCLMNQGKNEPSLEPFQKATRLKPDLVNAYVRWGQALGRLRRGPEAIEQLKHALDLSPTNREARPMLDALEGR